MTNFDVVTVGAAVLDIFMKSDNFRVGHAKEVPGGVAMYEAYGGKMEVEEVTISSGGGATNTACSFARKELKTAVIAEMGNDPQALIIHKDLEEDGVETRYLIQEPNEVTAVSVILIAKDGGRSIMVHRGASALLTKRDLPLADLTTRWLYISSLGGNIALLKVLLAFAKRSGVRVSLNPGMKEIEEREKLLPLLSDVEVLFVNREEAGKLWGVRVQDDEIWQKALFPSQARVTVVTDAERGGKMITKGEAHWWRGRKEAKVVDTTGAGDAFASGYVSGILYGKDYEQAVEWGIKNATAVLGYVGAKQGLLTLGQVNK